MIHNTCNMGACDLPDMYALSPRALGIHIRQIPRAHVTTITCCLVGINNSTILEEGVLIALEEQTECSIANRSYS